MKILVIDDSDVMRRIHINTLVDHKVPRDDILEAPDGEVAMAIAKEQKIDLFLIDWNMPKLDGFTFVKALRSTDTYAKTPMVMITSEAAKYNVVEAINAGVTNYIVKPIKGDILWQKLSKYIEEGGAE